MDLNDILKQVDYRLNKEQTGATMTPAQIQNTIELVNILFFNWKYGLPQEYQPGMYMPRQAWEVTRLVSDDLGHLLVCMDGVDNPLLLLNSDGIAELPADYLHASSAAYFLFKNSKVCNVPAKKRVRPISFLFDEEVDSRLGDPNRLPTKEFPVATIRSRKIRVYPESVDRIKFNYLRKPARPVYGFDIVDDVPVYNASKSTQFEWPENCYPDIINLIVDIVSDNLRESFNKRSAEQKIARGV